MTTMTTGMAGPMRGPATGLTLGRVAHRVDGTDSALARHPMLRPYLTDLTATHGLALDDEVAGTGQAYAELAAPAVEAVTSPDEPVDLLVLAYGVPDVQPGRSAAVYLASRCPGDPLAFAICDQGPAAAFTALRLIADYGAARAVLVVAEQAAVPYPLLAPAPVPDRHSVVALLLESGPAPVAVRTHPGVSADAVDGVLAADIAELSGARDDVTLVLGPGLDSGVDGTAGGLPYTGLWARLADGEPGGLLVFADHDPGLGYLCVAALEPSPRPTAALAAVAGSGGRGGGVADMAVKD
jgi:4-hydroxymandelate oxidase